jgi:PEP-CTERM motif
MTNRPRRDDPGIKISFFFSGTMLLPLASTIAGYVVLPAYPTEDPLTIPTRVYLLLASVTVFAAISSADPLSIDGMWHTQFQLMQASGETFATEYTASDAETVLISGYYENTDQYQVYVNGALDLTTNAISGAAVDYGDNFGTYTDPSTAYGSGLFSQGEFMVAADDVIKIVDIGPLFADPAQGPGEFDAQVGLMAVPEPAFVAIAGLAIAGFSLIRRRGSRG